MKTIRWCTEQRRGVRLSDPDSLLALRYLDAAKESLVVLSEVSSPLWMATVKYYAEYFGAYALLIHLGLRCEIHDCTIAVCAFLEEEDLFPQGWSSRLKVDKELRLQNQYYLKEHPVPVEIGEMTIFLEEVATIIQQLTEEKRESVREALSP